MATAIAVGTAVAAEAVGGAGAVAAPRVVSAAPAGAMVAVGERRTAKPTPAAAKTAKLPAMSSTITVLRWRSGSAVRPSIDGRDPASATTGFVYAGIGIEFDAAVDAAVGIVPGPTYAGGCGGGR